MPITTTLNTTLQRFKGVGSRTAHLCTVEDNRGQVTIRPLCGIKIKMWYPARKEQVCAGCEHVQGVLKEGKIEQTPQQ